MSRKNKMDFETLGHYDNGLLPGDLDHLECDILRDKISGSYYLRGQGGPRTWFGKPSGCGNTIGSEGTIWVPDDVAFGLLEALGR